MIVNHDRGVCGRESVKNRCWCNVTNKKVLLRKVVVIKVTIKKATYVDLTEQYKILFIFSIATLNSKRVLI